jgi:hypothetical protein
LGKDYFQFIKRRQANWIGYILLTNCVLKHLVEVRLEGRMEVTRRRGIRRKKLVDDLKEKRGDWKVKEETLDRTLWRTRFGRSHGPVARQTAE